MPHRNRPTIEWLKQNYPPEQLRAAGVIATRTRPAPQPRPTPEDPRVIAAASGTNPYWVEISVAGHCFASDNLRARGVKAWADAKRRDRRVVVELIRDGGALVPLATTRRRVGLTIEKQSRAGVRDPQNCLKSFFDALVYTGLLRDDTPEWMEWTPPLLIVRPEIRWRYISTITLCDIDVSSETC